MSTARIEGRDVSPLYLYAIVPSGPEGATPATDGMADRVSMIGAGRYAAVVGDGLAQGLKGRSREELGRLLVAHQQVVERIMRTTPLLPVQFGTQVPDERGVRKVLERGSSLFESAFAEFRGCTQLEILVTWDLDAVLTAIAAEEPIVSLKARLVAEKAASLAEREAFGHHIKDALDLRRATLAARVSAQLRAEAIDDIVHPVTDDRVVLHLALLLKNDALAAVDRQLEALDAEYGGQLRFRCVGPMPPSSFATVQVDFLDADAIERAGRVLDVDVQASLDDVRAVYHRRARTTHPDAANADGHAQAMAELTDAYKVLSLYARARRTGASGDEPGDFDPSSDTRAVLVSLRRQDSAADAGAGNG